jgi:hypothetical protein
MSLPPKPKSRPVILRTLLAGALAAGSLVACGDDDGGTPAIDARENTDGPIAPQPPPLPPDAQAPDGQAADAQPAADAEALDAQ